MVTARVSRPRPSVTGPVWQYLATGCYALAGCALLRAMLRPQDGPTRERKRLDGLWRFRLDPAGAGRGEGWGQQPLAGARGMPPPPSYTDTPPPAAVRDHVGDAWYQTAVRVPRGWAGQRAVLR